MDTMMVAGQKTGAGTLLEKYLPLFFDNLDDIFILSIIAYKRSVSPFQLAFR
jgi:hypothetical protein